MSDPKQEEYLGARQVQTHRAYGMVLSSEPNNTEQKQSKRQQKSLDIIAENTNREGMNRQYLSHEPRRDDKKRQETRPTWCYPPVLISGDTRAVSEPSHGKICLVRLEHQGEALSVKDAGAGEKPGRGGGVGVTSGVPISRVRGSASTRACTTFDPFRSYHIRLTDHLTSAGRDSVASLGTRMFYYPDVARPRKKTMRHSRDPVSGTARCGSLLVLCLKLRVISPSACPLSLLCLIKEVTLETSSLEWVTEAIQEST